MGKAEDKVRDWWEGLQPRERAMMGTLGVTAVVCILGFVGIMIQSGLERIETRNAETREALARIHRHRLEVAKGNAVRAKEVTIPAEKNKVDLENYLGTITRDVGVSYPKFNRGERELGDVVESTGRIELKDLSIVELKDLLQKVESNPLVVVRELRVKQDLRDDEKLDVEELLIATFYKRGGAEAKDEEAGDGESEEGEE